MIGLTPDITEARVVRHGVLALTFADGLQGEVDVLDRMRGPVFEQARTPAGFGDSGVMARGAARLDAIAGTAQVRVVDAARPGSSVVRADVAHDSVDDVLDELERLAVPAADVSLARVELVGQFAGRKPDTRLVWADVVGVAGSNARLVGQYLAFMAVAGVIGCYGVVDRNPILIVGAMAVSPAASGPARPPAGGLQHP